MAKGSAKTPLPPIYLAVTKSEIAEKELKVERMNPCTQEPETIMIPLWAVKARKQSRDGKTHYICLTGGYARQIGIH